MPHIVQSQLVFCVFSDKLSTSIYFSIMSSFIAAKGYEIISSCYRFLQIGLFSFVCISYFFYKRESNSNFTASLLDVLVTFDLFPIKFTE